MYLQCDSSAAVRGGCQNSDTMHSAACMRLWPHRAAVTAAHASGWEEFVRRRFRGFGHAQAVTAPSNGHAHQCSLMYSSEVTVVTRQRHSDLLGLSAGGVHSIRAFRSRLSRCAPAVCPHCIGRDTTRDAHRCASSARGRGAVNWALDPALAGGRCPNAARSSNSSTQHC
jgi:hypothetical protein